MQMIRQDDNRLQPERPFPVRGPEGVPQVIDIFNQETR
jgi:hypothetical protein